MMSVLPRTLYLVVVAYLLTGLPNIFIHLVRTHFQSPLGLIHLACILLGCVSLILRWKGHAKLSRIAVLLAIGVPSILYASQSMMIAYPTYFHFPLTFVVKYPGGRVSSAGLDLIPATLFLLTWYRGTVVGGAAQAGDLEL